ncbi:hypothetical protein RJ639_003640 [Escallonia herrerae]|uniref:SCP domain-containing protein n=1 Tax=Escallonia herrerae TaxID=1293975 RepID=A0AA89AYN8_9ASTE|nr:hypothetical protein RJ639_003640 [Escallonia herrerae]
MERNKKTTRGMKGPTHKGCTNAGYTNQLLHQRRAAGHRSPRSLTVGCLIGRRQLHTSRPLECTWSHNPIFFITPPCNNLLVSSNSPVSAPEKPDNKTVYRVTKQLCWGCIGESFEFLLGHNLVRAAKLEIPLVWDFQLEKYAKWWAGQRKADCKLMHSFPEYEFNLGENIYWRRGSTWRPRDAVRAWAEEEKYYTYATNSCESGQQCGHHTQIVWRGTRRIGCARVVCVTTETCS